MIQKIVCIGAGFVGGPLGTTFAYQCPEIQVTVVDINKAVVDAWNSESLPLYEPGLSDVLSSVRQRSNGSICNNGTSEDMKVESEATSKAYPHTKCNLTFSTDVETAIQEAEMIMLCIDTPTKMSGLGKGSALDMTNLEAAVMTIARVAKTDKIIVEKSTVPCGTASALRELLDAKAGGACRFEVLSNPEFLSAGTALSDLLSPSRVLIGCPDTPSGHQASEELASIYRRWVPEERIILMDSWSSELCKLAANAILAQRVSSINSLAAICEETGADIDFVSQSCGLDQRINQAMLQPSLGWGGGCFQKDVLCLAYLARSLGLHQVANYWTSVVEVNEYQKLRFLDRIITHMHGYVGKKSIAVLGFAFKKNTSDTKNSAAIPLVQGLLAEGAFVSIYDPLVLPHRILADVNVPGTTMDQLRIAPTAYEACAGVEAVVVAIDLDSFGTPTKLAPQRLRKNNSKLLPYQHRTEPLDWPRIVDGMRGPRYIFDGRNMLDGEYLRGLGCQYVSVGKQPK